MVWFIVYTILYSSMCPICYTFSISRNPFTLMVLLVIDFLSQPPWWGRMRDSPTWTDRRGNPTIAKCMSVWKKLNKSSADGGVPGGSMSRCRMVKKHFVRNIAEIDNSIMVDVVRLSEMVVDHTPLYPTWGGWIHQERLFRWCMLTRGTGLWPTAKTPESKRW